MKLNQAGIDLVKHFEGCYLDAYPDPGTGGEPITIGYGHTGRVKMGDKITQERADELLALDMQETAGKVLALLRTNLSDNAFSALVSFTFNVGIHNLANSTLLKLANEDDMHGAAAQFLLWNHAAGKVMAGLTKRRQAESDLFLA